MAALLDGFRLTGSGPAVVLLHSSLSSSTQWFELSKSLDSHFTCINIDLFGYGRAPEVDDPESFQLLTEVERVIAIIESQIGDANFSIVGHSFGGAVGLRLAYALPSRICAMVLYEPVAFHLLDPQSEAHTEIMQMAGSLNAQVINAGAQIFVDYWNGKGFFQQMPDKVQTSFQQQMAKVMLDFKAITSETCTIADYVTLTCPILVMEGRSSRLSAKTLAKLLADELPNASHQVFDGGHMAPLSHSVAVAGVIRGFLKLIINN